VETEPVQCRFARRNPGETYFHFACRHTCIGPTRVWLIASYTIIITSLLILIDNRHISLPTAAAAAQLRHASAHTFGDLRKIKFKTFKGNLNVTSNV